MLMVRAGARVRREQNEKINIIIDAQIANEDRFARNEERFATLAEDLNRSHDELAERIGQSNNELSHSLAELAQAQIRTETRLNLLIEAINRDRNGNSG